MVLARLDAVLSPDLTGSFWAGWKHHIQQKQYCITIWAGQLHQYGNRKESSTIQYLQRYRLMGLIESWIEYEFKICKFNHWVEA